MEILTNLEKRGKCLKQAFLPQNSWQECIVLEDGTIFTSKENYNSWLENKDKPIEVMQTLDEKVDSLNKAGLFIALKLLDKEIGGDINV